MLVLGLTFSCIGVSGCPCLLVFQLQFCVLFLDRFYMLDILHDL